MKKQIGYIEVAKRFLDVYDTYFSKYYTPAFDNKYRAIHQAAQEMSERSNGKLSIDIKSGATRIVLIVNEHFAVKMDYKKWGRCGSSYTELRMFKKAERDGYANVFAPVRRYCVNHHAYYIMPFCTTAVDRGGDPIDEMDCDVIDYIYDNVSDLHRGNIGWLDGSPVLLDYAANQFSWR